MTDSVLPPGGRPTEALGGDCWGGELRPPSKRYEERTVRILMKKCGLEQHIPLMRRCQRERFDKSELTLPWFNLPFPDFPVQLTAEHVPWVHKVQLRELFSDPMRTIVFRTYRRFLEQITPTTTGSIRSAGLVFTWPKATRMVLHNFARRPRHPHGPRCEPRFLMRFLIGDEMLLIMEPFDAFLWRVGSSWKTPAVDYGVDAQMFPLFPS